MPEAPRHPSTPKSAEASAGKVERDTSATVERLADTQRRVGETATEQGRQTVEAAADSQRRIADAVADRSGRVLDSVSRAAEIYREVIATTTEDMTVLLSSCSAVASGFQDVQRTWLETMQRSLQSSMNAPRALLGASDLSEVAQRQRDAWRDSFDALLEGNGRMLHVIGKMAEDAARSIEARGRP